MYSFYNYYDFPEYPLSLMVDTLEKKYKLRYGLGQTVTEKSGYADLKEDLKTVYVQHINKESSSLTDSSNNFHYFSVPWRNIKEGSFITEEKTLSSDHQISNVKTKTLEYGGLLTIDNNVYIMSKLGRGVMYFTGYQFIYCKDVYSISNIQQNDNEELLPSEICSSCIELPPNADDFRFVNNFGFASYTNLASVGRWINYNPTINIAEKLEELKNNPSLNNKKQFFHDIIPIHNLYRKEWECFKELCV